MFQIDHSACNQHLTTTQLYIKNEYILYINEITCNLYFQQSIYRKQHKQQCSNSKFSIRTFRTGNPCVTNWYFMFSNNFHVQDYRYHTTEFLSRKYQIEAYVFLWWWSWWRQHYECVCVIWFNQFRMHCLPCIDFCLLHVCASTKIKKHTKIRINAPKIYTRST